MRVHDDSNRRKAIDLLFNIPRNDVSQPLCDSWREAVDAMTTAIEPTASDEDKEKMRKAMAKFQTCVANDGKESIRHSPTGEQVFFSPDERRACDAAPQMVTYNQRLAETYAKQPLSELVSTHAATDLTVYAASVVVTFVSQSRRFEGDDVKWIPAGANGNELHVGSEVGYGYGGYGHVRAPRPSREQQAKSTLRGLRPLYAAMAEMRDKLRSELLSEDVDLSVEDLQGIASNRPGAAFVIACVYLLEEAHRIAGAGILEDFHLVDTANPNASFKHHADDHAEHDDPPGAYIERSVGCLLSTDVESSMAVAGIGEVKYGGQGSFVSFPAWAIHSSVPGEAAVAWKLVAFFRPKTEEGGAHPR